ncbi:MAG: hypothetical protein VKL41_21270 [Snowella sp.]|nr:hypothetical protein [Snowella sp.]
MNDEERSHHLSPVGRHNFEALSDSLRAIHELPLPRVSVDALLISGYID